MSTSPRGKAPCFLITYGEFETFPKGPMWASAPTASFFDNRNDPPGKSLGDLLIYLALSSQKATALAAATFKESTPWYMGIITV